MESYNSGRLLATCDQYSFLSATTKQCVSCNIMVGALAVVINGNSCQCVAGYVWSTSLGYCICDYQQNFYPIGSVCYDCTAVPNTSGNASQSGCGCSAGLSWSISQGQCAVCNPSVSITNAAGQCIPCSSIANSAGYPVSQSACACNSNYVWVISNGVGSCNSQCSAGLVWNSAAGICDCGTNSAMVTVGGSYVCIACNSAVYSTGKSTPNTCACSSPMAWNSTLKSCSCGANLILQVSGSTYSCVSNIVTNVTTNNPVTCAAGSIILPENKCLTCSSGSTISKYTCACSTLASPWSIWDDINKRCAACGTTAVPNSMAGYYGVACRCVGGYIWDVMTNTCIRLSSTYTMTCSSIPDVLANSASLPVSQVAVRNLAGGSDIQTLYSYAGTNYFSISSNACPCSSGFSWDSYRLRCFSNIISLA